MIQVSAMPDQHVVQRCWSCKKLLEGYSGWSCKSGVFADAEPKDIAERVCYKWVEGTARQIERAKSDVDAYIRLDHYNTVVEQLKPRMVAVRKARDPKPAPVAEPPPPEPEAVPEPEPVAEPEPLLPGREFRPRRVIPMVSRRLGITVAEITGQSRSQTAIVARRVIAMLAREAGYSLNEIGAMLGGRDHSTVLCALGRYKAKNKTSSAYERQYARANLVADEIREQLGWV